MGYFNRDLCFSSYRQCFFDRLRHTITFIPHMSGIHAIDILQLFLPAQLFREFWYKSREYKSGRLINPRTSFHCLLNDIFHLLLFCRSRIAVCPSHHSFAYIIMTNKCATLIESFSESINRRYWLISVLDKPQLPVMQVVTPS